jgi:glutathione S-transferase
VLGSKDMKKMNPAVMFPMVEVSSGVSVCGIAAICKHMARSAQKLLGADAL